MDYQADGDTYPGYARIPMITVSDDGYIRLTLEIFLAIPLAHLISDFDDDKPMLFPRGASMAHLSGYTEWLSTMTPNITLGWDWLLDVSNGHPLYVRLGAARSNIMLVDAMQHDLGTTTTSVLLETVIDALTWQEIIHQYIVSRYTH